MFENVLQMIADADLVEVASVVISDWSNTIGVNRNRIIAM